MKHLSTSLKSLFMIVLMAGIFACAGNETRSSTGEYIDDTVITTKVKAAIFNESSLRSLDVSVETDQGIVQLSGFVNSQAEINTAGLLAGGVQGVKSVQNSLQLR